ncbi:hypothetical protein OXPF_00300 [Oxobacter pfennigii]|uniref:Uncharacterized protein n=1 Tax=Oxobacter pfennigii TaxID=36849 RepID=A0A0P8X609_9CLOT|nr:hypothetical protein [Oxobacter pfennigii]KPU46358.1 hypothetical protein OXPF_00300 [Oxobacter pfennigii]
MSRRFKEEYEKSDLNGIVSFQKIDGIRVSKMKQNSPIPTDYYYVTPIISNIKVDNKRSKIYGQQHGLKCSECNPRETMQEQYSPL